MKKSNFMILIATFLSAILWVSANVAAGTFFDNFDDGDADGWWLSERGNWSIEDGIIIQDRGATGGGEDHVMGMVEDLLISDQLIETQVSTSGYGGVAFWYQDDMNYVSVSAYPFSAGLMVLELMNGTSSLSVYGYRTGHNRWYDLMVDIDSLAGTLAIYLDDNYLFTYNAITTYRTGLSGITSGNAGAHFDNFRLTSNDIAPIPEPATVLLFGSGLIVLAGFRKKVFRFINNGH